jgi:hypothetical protein
MVMVMVPRIDISEIQLLQLNTASLALIAKFAHCLQKHYGKVISLRDEHALRVVVSEAKHTDSAELREIYTKLKYALKTHLNTKQGQALLALNIRDSQANIHDN